MAIKNNKVFAMFKNDFSIGLFYKPSMGADDVYYYLILDEKVRIKCRIITGILIINEIIPLTDAYLSNFYKKLINFLKDQTFFTVVIDKLGATSVINDTCISMSIPVVEDKRLISIPEMVYNKIIQLSESDTNKYGFYLLAVVENKENTKINEENLSISLYDRLNKYFINLGNHCVQQVDGTDYTHVILYKNNMMRINIVIEEDRILIKDIEANCSRIYFIELMEYLEKFDDTIEIILLDVNDAVLYDVCKLRKYPKVPIGSGKMGSYKIVQLQKAKSTYTINGMIVESI